MERIAIIGVGTMGHGIASDFARGGFEVAVCDISAGRLAQALVQIEQGLEEFVSWDLLPPAEVQATMARIRTTTSIEEAAGDAELVIETVFEDLALKQEVFRQLDQVCPADTILASNTSSFMPSLLAPATNRPEQVVVAHFFYPPPLMPLVEVVRGSQTTDETVQAVYRTLQAAGKSPIIIQKEAMGFLANRLQLALLREALYIVEQGIASAQDVDTAVYQSFGRRLAVAGPLQMGERYRWAGT
jgi:3-hydroxybutyryl-CoA dehydrogenase